MKCKTHPRYRAVRKPTTGCKVCALLWYIQRLRKALGFSHAVAKPRLSSIARIAVKDASRVRGEIAQVLAAKSPYLNLVSEAPFPAGLGTKTPNFAANLEATPAEVIKALGAPWKEPTDAVLAERKAQSIKFQKAMSDEDTKTNP